MAEVATSTGFTREALQDVLAAGPPAERTRRERAFERFERIPFPSPETEEWRYTDLTGLDLS